MVKKMRKKTKKTEKKEKVIKEEVKVKESDIGEILELIADENNPIGDGLEYKDGEEHE